MLSISSIMALVFSRSNPERVSTETLMVLVLPAGISSISICVNRKPAMARQAMAEATTVFLARSARRSRASYLPSSACIITWEREVSFSLGRIFTKSSGTSVRAPSIEASSENTMV